MPARYPDVYPELFTGLGAETTLRVLQAVGSTHDGRLKSADEVSRVIEQVSARTARLRPTTAPLSQEAASCSGDGCDGRLSDRRQHTRGWG